ncbi:MAG: methyltransferase [Verrucomicrobiaceae bacterium]|nr:methyltransferase [Verrucomicrobiaceae bacterium]
MRIALPNYRHLIAASAIVFGTWLQSAPVSAANATTASDSNLQAILNGTWRSEQNRARDQYRHPAQTLEFFNVHGDITLIEITPGAGWFTEILAPLLHEHGTYYAAIVAPNKAPPQQQAMQTQGRDKLKAKFKDDPERYSRANIIEFDPAAPSFGKPASADVVVTFRNVHNWVNSGTEAAYFRAFFNVLKPGGTLGIEDHRAKSGSALDINSGYLPEEYVVKLATDAGFKLVARSEINANPADTKDYPKGVWTLPPTLTLGEQDKAKYLAIGESDRFTLRFIKPTN